MITSFKDLGINSKLFVSDDFCDIYEVEIYSVCKNEIDNEILVSYTKEDDDEIPFFATLPFYSHNSKNYKVICDKNKRFGTDYKDFVNYLIVLNKNKKDKIEIKLKILNKLK